MKNKILKWIFRIVIALILLVLLAFSGFALGERIVFWSFYGNADIYEKIPGLWEGYVPQGYSFLDGTDTRIMYRLTGTLPLLIAAHCGTPQALFR